MALKRPRISYWNTGLGWRWHRQARNGKITHASEEAKFNLAPILRDLHARFPECEYVEIPGGTFAP